MRLAYFSDIHLEIRAAATGLNETWTEMYPLRLGPDMSQLLGELDLVILAGDIGRAKRDAAESALKYAWQLSTYLYAPVVFVPGNHEYYADVYEDARRAMLSAKIPGVMVLDRQEASFAHPDGSLRILGATLWTDYRVLGDQAKAMDDAERGMADHRCIQYRRGRQFRPADALAEHEMSRRWLVERLEARHEGPTVVVTHHVPHLAARNPRFASNDPFMPAFCSDCGDIIQLAKQAGVSAWIFGHHHHSLEIRVDGLPMLSAQWGYPGERTGWKGPGILNV